MSQSSDIEWTDATWNPTRGCRELLVLGLLGCALGGDDTLADTHLPLAKVYGIDPKALTKKVKAELEAAKKKPAAEVAKPSGKKTTKAAPKKAPKKKPAKGKGQHRHEAVPEADELAERGVCTLVRLGPERWEVVAVRQKENAAEWRALALGAQRHGRVRTYDRSPRCTWDSLDGDAP